MSDRIKTRSGVEGWAVVCGALGGAGPVEDDGLSWGSAR